MAAGSALEASHELTSFPGGTFSHLSLKKEAGFKNTLFSILC